jgi:glutathione S-transferase
MTDMILHHYETSPYAEKVRLGLGLKGPGLGIGRNSGRLTQLSGPKTLAAI